MSVLIRANPWRWQKRRSWTELHLIGRKSVLRVSGLSDKSHKEQDNKNSEKR
jgi:hypothetical protein